MPRPHTIVVFAHQMAGTVSHPWISAGSDTGLRTAPGEEAEQEQKHFLSRPCPQVGRLQDLWSNQQDVLAALEREGQLHRAEQEGRFRLQGTMDFL